MMRSGGVFLGVAAVWLIIDQLTKAYFQGAYALGEVSAASYGLFRFRLVHNTGMAWGLFGDSTFMLGITSLLVCAAIVAAFVFYRRLTGHAATLLETCALALVFSGGLGNAIDRFSQAYVVDFIDLTFIDFPVFNIADIGVTCGFALLIVGYLAAVRADGRSLEADVSCEGAPAAEEGPKDAARGDEAAKAVDVRLSHDTELGSAEEGRRSS